MNVQHMASKGEWYTPQKWIELVRKALGHIGLDPCSSAAANAVVGARMYLDHLSCSLSQPWHLLAHTAFVNPPGSCVKIGGVFSVCGRGDPNRTRCSCKLPRRFLAKTLSEAALGLDSVFLAFSVNQLRQLSNIPWPAGVSVSIAIPPDRIPYLDSETLEPVKGTGFDSAFVCVSTNSELHAKFSYVFSGAGCAVYTGKGSN
mgnify:CR=1 FL=1